MEQLSTKRPRDVDTLEDVSPQPHKRFKNSGMCTNCTKFHGIEENDGKCSHCYSWMGPDVYRNMAMSMMRSEEATKEMRVKFGINPYEMLAFLAIVKTVGRSTGGVCAASLYNFLWTTECLDRRVYVSAKQAHAMYAALRQHGMTTCSLRAMETYLFSNVFDFWNIDIERLFHCCSLLNRGQKRPENLQSAEALMDSIRNRLPAPAPHHCEFVQF